MWGINSGGQLGNGTTDSPVIKPTCINSNSITFKEVKPQKVHPGAGTNLIITAGITTDDYLYTWGHGYNGLLGNGTSGSSAGYVTRPQKITINDENGNEVKFRKVSVGYSHAVAIDKNGNLWAWGNNASNRTGIGSTSGKTLVPKKITSGIEFKEISAGYSHSMALTKDGILYTWGAGSNGQLCTGNTTAVKTPTKVDTGTTTFTKISAGYGFGMAIDNTGQLWGCGSNGSGQLGNGNTSAVTAFTKNIINKNDNKAFTDISCGYANSMAIDEDEKLWGWGDNEYGQLGDGSNVKKTSPIQILADTKIKKFSCGSSYFIAVAEDESGNEQVYTCGSNLCGRLGDNSTVTNRRTPFKITINDET